MVNLTNWSAMGNIGDLLTEANTNSPFWLMVLGLITAVLFITFNKSGVVIAGLGALFLGFVIGLFLAYLGLVAWFWVLMLLGLLIALIFYVIIGGSNLTK